MHYSNSVVNYHLSKVIEARKSLRKRISGTNHGDADSVLPPPSYYQQKQDIHLDLALEASEKYCQNQSKGTKENAI